MLIQIEVNNVKNIVEHIMYIHAISKSPKYAIIIIDILNKTITKCKKTINIQK